MSVAWVRCCRVRVETPGVIWANFDRDVKEPRTWIKNERHGDIYSRQRKNIRIVEESKKAVWICDGIFSSILGSSVKSWKVDQEKITKSFMLPLDCGFHQMPQKLQLGTHMKEETMLKVPHCFLRSTKQYIVFCLFEFHRILDTVEP